MRFLARASFVHLALLLSSVAHATPISEGCTEDIGALAALTSVSAAAEAVADLPNTPSPATFADAWAARFREAVKSAAGADGRLSRSEARRMSEADGWPSLFADDAQALLGATGQQTISVDRITKLGRDAALASAMTAAGSDSRLSLADGQRLSSSLIADFLWLRGKGGPASSRTPAQLAADVLAEVNTGIVDGTMTKLSTTPSILAGRTPIATGVPDAVTGGTDDVYVADGKIYVSRATSSPSPLAGFYVVGNVPDAPIAAARASLRTAIETNAKDLWLTSERDAKVKFISAENAGNAAIGPDFITSHFTAAHDLLVKDIYDSQNWEVAPLAGRSVEERGASDYLTQISTNQDPADPAMGERAAKFAAIKQVIDSKLTDVHVFRFVNGAEVSIFVVGKTATGDVAGFLSAAIET